MSTPSALSFFAFSILELPESKSFTSKCVVFLDTPDAIVPPYCLILFSNTASLNPVIHTANPSYLLPKIFCCGVFIYLMGIGKSL